MHTGTQRSYRLPVPTDRWRPSMKDFNKSEIIVMTASHCNVRHIANSYYSQLSYFRNFDLIVEYYNLSWNFYLMYSYWHLFFRTLSCISYSENLLELSSRYCTSSVKRKRFATCAVLYRELLRNTQSTLYLTLIQR
jgi:hypothetical protein